jgi:glucans biosynthesis protein
MGEGIPGRGPTAQVVSTRVARTGPNRARFVLDFVGPTLGEERLQQPLHVAVRAQGGQIVEQHIERNRKGGGCRAAFEVVREHDEAPVDLRAFLHAGSDVLTETWSFLWQQNL